MAQSAEERTPESITELEPKMQLEGVVRKVELYGAFVDLGLERDGLIHISQLSERRVDKVTDVVQEGDKVVVWVLSVDPDQGRIGLTLVEPAEVEWRELSAGQSYTGRVVRIEPYGVFVDFGAERPGLLHVREMGHQYVRHPSDIFSMGDEVEVRVNQVDRRRRRIDLGLVDLTETDYLEEEDREAPPTPMEAAFLKAQKEARERKRSSSKSQRRKSQRTEQEDIYARTLRRHEEK